MKDQINRVVELIEKLRKISQIDEGGLPLEKTEIVAIIKKSKDLVKKSFPNREINVIFNPSQKKAYVEANELMQDIFINLLTNAIKYNTESIAEIDIRISRIAKNGKNHLKIEVLDNAKGIQDSRKETIFLRALNEEKSTKGMGLGLSLVFKIVQSYSGKISVENKIKDDHSQGSNFIIIFPELT